ncbi:glycerophosphodiester phosphodiesterase family protein [Algihabitans albus]|uniref:glycerophosphodiester phosphodiesterase family protein n=1 Tax=Algihabitans albus TaxID=2164067 RepID=UPI0013C2AB02|nr:glycerophosphodiester phosphodiesterase family protein [Algihabitans albus]
MSRRRALALPRIIGHRGAAGRAPENTLGGLRKAAELGATWVEVDVMLTADDVPILHHDYNFARTCGHPAEVATLSSTAVAQLDAGAWFPAGSEARQWIGEVVPTLEQAVVALSELRLNLNLELKPTPGRAAETAEVTLDLLTRIWPSGRPSPLISSFSGACLEVARDLTPELPRGRLWEELPTDWQAEADALGCASIHLWCERLTHAQALAVKAAGYRLAVFTVNEREDAARFLEWGVDSLFTDLPDAILPAGHSAAAWDGA